MERHACESTRGHKQAHEIVILGIGNKLYIFIAENLVLW